MKYVLLGSISPSWLGKQAERLKKSNEKLKQLGIKQDSVLYTQGQYDFVETIDAPGPESVLGFTIWYSKKDLAIFRHCRLLEIRKYGR